MLNTRRNVVQRVGFKHIELEAQVDTALVNLAGLQAAAIEGRRQAKLPLHAGQEGLEKLAVAAASLIAARKAIHDAHLSFRDVQDGMRVGPVSFGDYGDTPREATLTEPAELPALTVVRAA
ncbi:MULTISPECIES: hypothetical protein [unclassified Sphingomonas]|jgi:hypothetical protein|uniref:hypothetical protein n=1 Tax=unclassified Sphingomonas TaxID=196159 RepID=UPI00226ADA0D|nr:MULTISPECIES: hypothetical protein [unclassified Sphingomonas]